MYSRWSGDHRWDSDDKGPTARLGVDTGFAGHMCPWSAFVWRTLHYRLGPGAYDGYWRRDGGDYCVFFMMMMMMMMATRIRMGMMVMKLKVFPTVSFVQKFVMEGVGGEGVGMEMTLLIAMIKKKIKRKLYDGYWLYISIVYSWSWKRDWAFDCWQGQGIVTTHEFRWVTQSGMWPSLSWNMR